MKLTQSLRYDIKNALLFQRFNDDDKSLRTRKDEAMEKAYKHFFNAHIMTLDALPRMFTRQACCFAFKANGEHCYHEFLDKKKRYVDVSNDTLILKDKILLKEIAQIHVDLRTIAEKKMAVGREIMAILNSVTTAKRLADAWPEVIPFIPSEAGIAAVPMVQVTTVNKHLGLPPKEKK